jgi:hypothetical protein
MNDSVIEAIKKLRLSRDKLYEAGKLLTQAMGTDLYTLDFFLIAALNRSFCLLRGFCDLLESSNFISAAPLVRLQLDNCLRIFAISLVADPNKFASDVLGGKSVRNIKDATNCPMRDNYLCNELSKQFPWVQNVYDETSGFVHLSEKHIFNSLKIDSTDEHLVSLKISDQDKFVPDSAYMEAIEVFEKITELFLSLFYTEIQARANFNKISGKQAG